MWKRRLCLLVLLCAAGLLYLFENNTGTRLFLAAALLLPLVAALPLLPRPRLACTWDVPASAARGEEISWTLHLRARRPGPPRFAAQLEITNLLTGERTTQPVACTLRAGRGAIPLTLTAAHSGVLQLTLRRACVQDAFPLFARRLPSVAAARILIRPARTPVDVSPDDFWRDSDRYSTTRAGTDPSETFRIRDYVPGDPVRQIHWKLSEKLDRPLVRDFGLPLGERVLLTLLPSPATPDEVDAALDDLFSIGASLASLALPATVQTPAASQTLCTPEDWTAFQTQLLSTRLPPVRLQIEGLQAKKEAAHAAGNYLYHP